MNNYIIVSVKHGSGKKPMFWRAEDKGYCHSPFIAGIYTKEQIEAHPNYYNNGENTIAVELTEQAMEAIGFKCSYDNKKIMEYFKKS